MNSMIRTGQGTSSCAKANTFTLAEELGIQNVSETKTYFDSDGGSYDSFDEAEESQRKINVKKVYEGTSDFETFYSSAKELGLIDLSEKVSGESQ